MRALMELRISNCEFRIGIENQEDVEILDSSDNPHPVFACGSGHPLPQAGEGLEFGHFKVGNVISILTYGPVEG
jgi:hypothetical protein